MKLLSQCPPSTCSLPHIFLILVKSTSIPVNNVGHFWISLFSSQLTHKQVLLSYIQRITPARHCQSHPGPGLRCFSSGLLTPLIPFWPPTSYSLLYSQTPRWPLKMKIRLRHSLLMTSSWPRVQSPLLHLSLPHPSLVTDFLLFFECQSFPPQPSPVRDCLLPDTDRANRSLHSCLCSALSSQRSPPPNSLTSWGGRGRRHVSLLFITLHAASSRVPGAQ